MILAYIGVMSLSITYGVKAIDFRRNKNNLHVKKIDLQRKLHEPMEEFMH